MGIIKGIFKLVFRVVKLPFKVIAAPFSKSKKEPEEKKKELKEEIKEKKKEIRKQKRQLGRGKGFNEKRMRKRLSKLESSIRRNPDRLKYLEHLFKRYQAKIKDNYNVLRDKAGMNASLQSIINLIRRVKTRGAYKAKGEQEEMIEK
ncbi:hypothetical protein GF361_00295 [Candidatus Woesearchaeota archaeon]|nr:hypothetical protein [Candidatus Woesearchaeota archaeon]